MAGNARVDQAKMRDYLRGRVAEASRIALEQSAIIVQAEMIKELSKPGTGRLYRRSNGYGRRRNTRQKGYHRASAPGRPPAADTGNLRRSWQAGRWHIKDRKHIKDRIAPRIRIGTKVAYARLLEDGTSRMARRPSVQEALRMARVNGKMARAFRIQLSKVFTP